MNNGDAKAPKSKKLTRGVCPPTTDVWTVLSELLKDAYHYELQLEGNLPLGVKNPGALIGRMNNLIRFYVKLPPTFPKQEFYNTEEKLIRVLTGLYRKVTIGELAPEDIPNHPELKSFAGGLFDNMSKNFVRTKKQIHERRGGSAGGPYETALDVVGKCLHGVGRTKIRKELSKYREKHVGAPALNHMFDRRLMDVKMRDHVISRIDWDTATDRLFKSVALEDCS